MLTQADMLFHDAAAIPPTLRGIVYDVCTPRPYAECASQRARWSDSFCKCNPSESIPSFVHHTLILQDFSLKQAYFCEKWNLFSRLVPEGVKLSVIQPSVCQISISSNLLLLLWFVGACVARCIEKLILLHIMRRLFFLLVLCHDVWK